MSAAEKLERLDRSFRSAENQRAQADHIYLYRMQAVFPELIAVVKAAEAFVAKVDRGEAKSIRSYGSFSDALAALDEALS